MSNENEVEKGMKKIRRRHGKEADEKRKGGNERQGKIIPSFLPLPFVPSSSSLTKEQGRKDGMNKMG